MFPSASSHAAGVYLYNDKGDGDLIGDRMGEGDLQKQPQNHNNVHLN